MQWQRSADPPKESSEDFADHVAMHVDKPLLGAVVTTRSRCDERRAGCGPSLGKGTI